jgi:hypothetical protein
MHDPYSEMDDIWARALVDRSALEADVVALLRSLGIRLRQDDGERRQVTVSKPTSVASAYVAAVRYEKQDGTQAEDQFTVEPGGPIGRYYKGRLERRLPEYRGTHKEKVLFTLVQDDGQALPTSVNTITVIAKLYGGPKKASNGGS